MPQYRDCPVCGGCETVVIDWSRDSDGAFPYTRSWEFPEIVDTECGCVIPAEDADRILDEIAKDGPPDEEL